MPSSLETAATMGLLRNPLRRAVKLLRLLRHPAFRRGLRFGVAASLENFVAMRDLTLGSVIDAGANVGQFSLLMRGLHPTIEIHAFEPFPEAVVVFKRLFAADPAVKLYPVALGAAEGRASLHISRRSDNSSLLPISDNQAAFAPGTEEIGTVAVTVQRLDALLADAALLRPCLLKIDTQGGELEVLKGAEHLLPRIDYVYVELSFAEFYAGQPTADQILTHLHAQAYRLVGIGGIARDRQGAIQQADLLFQRSAL